MNMKQVMLVICVVLPALAAGLARGETVSFQRGADNAFVTDYQGFQDNLLIILGNFVGQQGILWQNPYLEITNFLIQLRRIEQEWRTKMLIGALLLFKLPCYLGLMREKQVARFSFSQQ